MNVVFWWQALHPSAHFDVDLAFYRTPWYNQFTSRAASLDSCAELSMFDPAATVTRKNLNTDTESSTTFTTRTLVLLQLLVVVVAGVGVVVVAVVVVVIVCVLTLP